MVSRLYVHLADDLDESLVQIAALAHTTKRNVIESMIATAAGKPHRWRIVVVAAARSYRAGARVTKP